MAYTDPTTVHVPAAGTTAPAAWGTAVNTDLNWLHDVPVCNLQKTGVQSINDSTDTAIIWETELYDSDSMFTSSDSTSNIIVPYNGIYLATAVMEFAGSAVGIRYLIIGRNTFARSLIYQAGTATGNTMGLSAIFAAAAGDTVQLYVNQSSGAPLDVGGANLYQSSFSVTMIRETST